MQASKTHKYALVQWIKENTLSTISTDWIVEFNWNNLDKTYLAEWRESGKKKTQEGWPVFEVDVLQVSGKLVWGGIVAS